MCSNKNQLKTTLKKRRTYYFKPIRFSRNELNYLL